MSAMACSAFGNSAYADAAALAELLASAAFVVAVVADPDASPAFVVAVVAAVWAKILSASTAAFKVGLNLCDCRFFPPAIQIVLLAFYCYFKLFVN